MSTASTAAAPKGYTREQVEAAANETLARHGLNSIPVDPVLLANKEGIKVLNAKFSEPNISGLIAKRGDATQILVEQNDSPTRKRFTIAHELAHYFLHLENDGQIVDSSMDLQRTTPETSAVGSYTIEVEANRFAAALLMPEKSVREVFTTVKNVDELSRIFRVSREAMGIRLNTLGLA